MAINILEAACVALGVHPSEVFDWKEYDEHINIVLVSGGKHAVQKAGIAPPKPAEKRKRAASKKKAAK